MNAINEFCMKCMYDYVIRNGRPFDYYRCDECEQAIFIEDEEREQQED